jgi:hypothetical protein
MQAALFANGKVVCGLSHGHAASCLTEEEKDKALSGWYDAARKKFVYDDRLLYMKEIVLVRHAHACQDHLTRKGISQITSSLKAMASFYKPGLEIRCGPSERCEHTAWFLSTHFCVPASVDDNLGEPVTDEKVVEALDSLPDCAIAITHSDFIRKAVAKIGGTFMSYVPNFCLMKLTGNHLDDMAVFYEDDATD